MLQWLSLSPCTRVTLRDLPESWVIWFSGRHISAFSRHCQIALQDESNTPLRMNLSSCFSFLLCKFWYCYIPSPIWYSWHNVSCFNLYFPDHQRSWVCFHIFVGLWGFFSECLLIFLFSDCFYFYKIKSKVSSWEWKVVGVGDLRGGEMGVWLSLLCVPQKQTWGKGARACSLFGKWS